MLKHVQQGDIDPSFVIPHRFSLEGALEAYRIFRDKQDECIKVVLDLWEERKAAWTAILNYSRLTDPNQILKKIVAGGSPVLQ